ncbi:MAG: GNAT family N-acetyltransferase [Gemmataceae bacterium]|nr:GNAT family N-acetyltransferase [Gemmataceae bacterium]
MSAMQVEVFGCDDPRWSEVVAALPHDFYQLPQYARIEARRLSGTAEAIAVADGDRRLFIPYLRRACSESNPLLSDAASAYGYPGMLLSQAALDRSFLAAAFDQVAVSLRETSIVSLFLRMHPLLNADVSSFAPEGLLHEEGDTVAFDLGGAEEQIFRGMREGHRVTVRKVREAGFTTRVVPLAEHLDAFIETYRQTMDRVKAKDNYYFGRGYYESLAAMPGIFHVHVAEKDGEPAAACIISECQGTMQAHLGGTRDAYLSASPFHMVLLEAALWGKRRGNRYLHLGGGLGGKSDRLLSFKSGFSSKRFRFQTVRLVCDEAAYRELIEARAAKDGVPMDKLIGSGFFPAYRFVL